MSRIIISEGHIYLLTYLFTYFSYLLYIQQGRSHFFWGGVKSFGGGVKL